MESTLDLYISKLNDLKLSCTDITTTQDNLTTILSDLMSICDTIDSELETIALPTTMAHLNKFILVQNARCNKHTIHFSLNKLLNLRENDQQSILDINGDYEAANIFISITKSLREYINDIQSSCSCMSGRLLIIENAIKKEKNKIN